MALTLTRNLEQGMKGSDVSQLQQFLNSQGAKLAVDGDFGPMTATAVKAFQQKNGLTSDGIVGNQTLGALNHQTLPAGNIGTPAKTTQAGSSGISTANSGTSSGNQTQSTSYKLPNGYGYIYDPSNNSLTEISPTGSQRSIDPRTMGGGSYQGFQDYMMSNGGSAYTPSPSSPTTTDQSTGDPAADKALAAIEAEIATLKNTGYQIPTGLQITPDLVAKFLTIAHQNVDPETQQFIRSAVTDLNASIKNQGNQFVNSQGQLIQDFGANLATEQNTAGANGTAFSGQRAINETNMANSTNRNLASLGAQTEYNIGNTLRTGAANVGAENAGGINTPSFSSLSVGVGGGQRGNVTSGPSLNYNYDPSLYTVGEIPSAGITRANALRDSYLSQYGTLAGNQSNSGRSVNDLINSISGLPAGYKA